MATMAEVRRITWSIYWKCTLMSLVGGLIAGFVVGFIIGAIVGIVLGPAAVATGPWPNVIRILSGLAGFGVGYLALNYLLANSIGKQIGSKKLVLVDAFAAGEK
jgi:hypothetical protein